MEERRDGQILFYRTPQAIVGGPTKTAKMQIKTWHMVTP